MLLVVTPPGSVFQLQMALVVSSKRRGSNPHADECNFVAAKRLMNSGKLLSGYCQETGDTNRLDFASIDIELRYVILCWNLLCDEQRQRISDICKKKLGAKSTRSVLVADAFEGVELWPVNGD